MKEEIRKLIEPLLNRKIKHDEEGFSAYDWFGGNMDDAYWGGVDAGETIMAQNILAILEKYENS